MRVKYAIDKINTVLTFFNIKSVEAMRGSINSFMLYLKFSITCNKL